MWNSHTDSPKHESKRNHGLNHINTKGGRNSTTEVLNVKYK